MTKKPPMNKVVGPMTMRIYDTVCRFLCAGQYSDDVQIQINREDLTVDIADPQQDLPNCDYYPMVELIRETEDGSGSYLPDDEAIASLAASYFVN